jgi:formylglycine-generating enzyme required for sulfatase activity
VLVGNGRDDQEVWIAPGSGESFRDADFAPEMVVVPAGRFMMGSPESEVGHRDSEGPQHEVAIPKPFAVGKYPVTFDEWDAYVAQAGGGGLFGIGGNKPRRPDDGGWGRGNRPVINVSWDDAQAYVKWLSGKTGKRYRLLSEAEWEYAARAGTTTRYAFGDTISTSQAQFSEGSRGSAGKTVEVGSFEPNAWGLHDMHGNVWEWVEDCWNSSYTDKPDSLKASGAAWTTGNCVGRVLRGGSWGNFSQYLRSAVRGREFWGDRSDSIGFRLARTLTP